MNLFLVFFVSLTAVQFSRGQLCKCVCSTCAAAPTFTDPPAAPGRTRGAGTITETVSASGCKQYTVTCYAAGNSLVAVGANGEMLSPEAPGQQTAVLLCNDNRMIEGCNMNDDTLIVSQVYCSNTIPPPPVCSTCASLPMTDPPVSPGTARGAGVVVESVGAGGCKTYSVTCYANGMFFVVIGANQQFIQLSPASPGEKSATLYCDANGQIEGSDPNGNTVIVQSVYCSNATPPGK